MFICKWCGQKLEFLPSKGWVHKGGGLYVQKCLKCGEKFSFRKATFICPNCGGELIDDHCVLIIKIEEH